MSIYLSISLDLFIYISFYQSIYLSFFLSIYLYIPLSLSIYLSTYLSIFLSISPSLPLYQFIYLSIYQSNYLSIPLSLSIYLSIHPSIHLSYRYVFINLKHKYRFLVKRKNKYTYVCIYIQPVYRDLNPTILTQHCLPFNPSCDSQRWPRSGHSSESGTH